jgi:hypothetical protein
LVALSPTSLGLLHGLSMKLVRELLKYKRFKQLSTFYPIVLVILQSLDKILFLSSRSKVVKKSSYSSRVVGASWPVAIASSGPLLAPTVESSHAHWTTSQIQATLSFF